MFAALRISGLRSLCFHDNSKLRNDEASEVMMRKTRTAVSIWISVLVVISFWAVYRVQSCFESRSGEQRAEQTGIDAKKKRLWYLKGGEQAFIKSTNMKWLEESSH